jgi:hypothetical protein
VSDRKGNKVSGQSVRLTDEQRIDWLRLGNLRNGNSFKASKVIVKTTKAILSHHVAKCSALFPTISKY